MMSMAAVLTGCGDDDDSGDDDDPAPRTTPSSLLWTKRPSPRKTRPTRSILPGRNRSHSPSQPLANTRPSRLASLKPAPFTDATRDVNRWTMNITPATRVRMEPRQASSSSISRRTTPAQRPSPPQVARLKPAHSPSLRPATVMAAATTVVIPADCQPASMGAHCKSIIQVAAARSSSSPRTAQFPMKTAPRPAHIPTARQKAACKSHWEMVGPMISICRTVAMPACSSSRTKLTRARPIPLPTHSINNQE